MHYFTKQMCQGGPRYGRGVRVGNWNEDVELSETMEKDFTFKKETGTLRLDEYHIRMSDAMAPEELTELHPDNYVRFDDVIQIHSLVSESAMACDLSDKDTRVGENACAVTCQPNGIRDAVARTSLTLSKYVPERPSVEDLNFDDDIVRYGQKVRIHMGPSYSKGDRWQLFSKMICPTHYAKYSRNQLVGMTTRNQYETVWKIVTPNPDERIVSEGVEVMAGAPINIIHCASNRALHLEDHVYENDFGREWEISAFTATGKSKKNACELANTGSIRSAIDKPMTNANAFAIVYAPPSGGMMPAEDEPSQ